MKYQDLFNLKSLSGDDQYLAMNIINKQANDLADMHRALSGDKFANTSRPDGSFGYYMGYNAYELISFIQEHKIKTFVDLGSGPGYMMKMIQRFTACTTRGFEIDPLYIEIGAKLGLKVVKKNLLTLTKKSIEDFELLYFWEPFCDGKLAYKFAALLVKHLRKDQIIAFQSGFAGWKVVENKSRFLQMKAANGLHFFKVVE